MADAEDKSIHEKISSFLAAQLAHTGEMRIVSIHVSHVTEGGDDEELARWSRIGSEDGEFESLPTLVDVIIDVGHRDVSRRASGRHAYAVCVTHQSGARHLLSFYGASERQVAEPPSSYFHMTTRSIRSTTPIHIEITTSENTKLIRIREPLDLTITTSIDSSHAPPVRQETTIDTIVAAIQPVIGMVFQKIDEARTGMRAQPAKPEPEN